MGRLLADAELLERCDEGGRPLGPVRRELCHGDPSLIHMTVHLHVFDAEGRLFLQKRSAAKDLYPRRWDTAVGGHVHAGESPWEALLREAAEELGIDARAARLLYAYLHTNEHESEFVHTFALTLPGPFALNREEIEEGAFFSAPEVVARLGTGTLTPNFEDEYARLTASGSGGPRT